MTTITPINDIDKIYENATPKHTQGGYQCPVCKKQYKQETRCRKHIEERDCYDVKTLFKGTHREEMARKLFMSIMASIGSEARSTLTAFRKHKSYAPVVRYSVFCSIYSIKNPELYYAWMRDVKGFKMMNAILKYAQKESNVGEFRLWLYRNPHYIANAEFIEKNGDCLEDDPKFFILSVERAHVSAVYYMQYFGLTEADIIGKLPTEYGLRFHAVLEEGNTQ